MHRCLRELDILSNSPICPLVDMDNETFSKLLSYFSGYIKSMFISSYNIECSIDNCYVRKNII